MSQTYDMDLPESPNFFNTGAPASDLPATAAMPRACAREMGDYSEGDYAEAVKTKQAPTMQDSTFFEVIQSRTTA